MDWVGMVIRVVILLSRCSHWMLRVYTCTWGCTCRVSGENLCFGIIGGLNVSSLHLDGVGFYASQSVRKWASRSISQSVGQSVSWLVRKWFSWSIGQLVSQSAESWMPSLLYWAHTILSLLSPYFSGCFCPMLTYWDFPWNKLFPFTINKCPFQTLWLCVYTVCVCSLFDKMKLIHSYIESGMMSCSHIKYTRCFLTRRWDWPW